MSHGLLCKSIIIKAAYNPTCDIMHVPEYICTGSIYPALLPSVCDISECRLHELLQYM